jgi:aerobic-type carbon monoxide dehydrogenase small subunit (CoxS/CutS family)
MRLTVNETEHAVVSEGLTPLLDVLREELGITGPKVGCHQGGCGACTVLVDGEPRRACLLPVGAVDGARITTLEGLGDPDELSPVQAAFHEHYAAQCGFCTSGMILAGHALIARAGGAVTREQVIDALAGHYCRCTGYAKIVEAIQAASRGEVETAHGASRAEVATSDQVEVPGAPA